jgi:hypothetical protein
LDIRTEEWRTPYADNFHVLWDSNPDIFRDIEKHHVPPIHADFQGQVEVYSIQDGSILAGELSPNKHKLVIAWIEIIKKICLPTGSWLLMAKNLFQLKDLINEYNCTPQPNWVLSIVANDCRVGNFDVSPYLKNEVFEALNDYNEFLKVFNGGYFIEWACGADLSADTIEARWSIVDQAA